MTLACPRLQTTGRQLLALSTFLMLGQWRERASFRRRLEDPSVCCCEMRSGRLPQCPQFPSYLLNSRFFPVSLVSLLLALFPRRSGLSFAVLRSVRLRNLVTPRFPLGESCQKTKREKINVSNPVCEENGGAKSVLLLLLLLCCPFAKDVLEARQDSLRNRKQLP